jgi:hypothetical protein
MRYNKPGYRGQADQTEPRGHVRNCCVWTKVQYSSQTLINVHYMGKIIIVQ